MRPTKAQMEQALSERHGKELQKRFSSASIAVCGLGGLGSNIAVCLARAGIGKLILIDFDRVDVANLNRQQYKAGQIGRYKADALKENLREIAPYLALEARMARIDETNADALLRDADIICEAFDDAECKAALTNAVLEKMPEKYLIAASGMAGLSSANSIQTKRVTKRLYLCGDGANGTESGLSLFSSRVMLCAAHQAHMALRILAEEWEP